LEESDMALWTVQSSKKISKTERSYFEWVVIAPTEELAIGAVQESLGGWVKANEEGFEFWEADHKKTYILSGPVKTL
jgi:hypothetical protein